MCDLLVMRTDNPGTDPFTYKAGMVVDVFEDGRLGPGAQQHPKFVVVRLPGIRAAAMRYLLEGPRGPEYLDEFLRPQRDVVRRRRDIFDPTKLTLTDRTTLVRDRDLTTSTEIATLTTRLYEDSAVRLAMTTLMVAGVRRTTRQAVAVTTARARTFWTWLVGLWTRIVRRVWRKSSAM